MNHVISLTERGKRILALVAVLLLLSPVMAGCGGGEDWVVNPANEHYYLVIECGDPHAIYVVHVFGDGLAIHFDSLEFVECSVEVLGRIAFV